MPNQRQLLRSVRNWSIAKTNPRLWLNASRGTGGAGARSPSSTDGLMMRTSFRAVGTVDESFCGWTKFNSLPATGILFYNHGTVYGVTVYTMTGGAARIFYGDGTTLNYIDTPQVFTTGEWHFWVVNVTRDDTLDLYVDDMTTPAYSWDISGFATADWPLQPYRVGRVGGYPLDGSTSRHGVAVGATLTESDRLELINNRNGKFAAELSPSLLAKFTDYWNMNEASGDVINQLDSLRSLTITGTVGATSGPRTQTAADIAGGKHGTLSGFADLITPWSADTPDGSYSATKLETASQVEMISNGDLESGSGDSFTDWSSPYANVHEETVEQYAGSRCVRLDIDGSNTYTAFSRPLLLEIGKTYTVTLWAKSNVASGKSFAIDGVPYIGSLTDEWVRHEVTATATATTLAFKRQNSFNTSLYFDEISCKLASPYNATMTGFSDVDAAHVDGPEGSWGPRITDQGSAGKDGWIQGTIADSRSADSPDGEFKGGVLKAFDASYQDPPTDGARALDGTDQKFTMSEVPTLGTDDFVIEFWMLRSGTSEYVFGMGGTSASVKGLTLYLSAANALVIYTSDGTNITGIVGNIPSTWAHVIVSVDRTLGVVTAWVDGVKQGTLDMSSLTGSLTPNLDRCCIGANLNSANTYTFSGSVGASRLSIGTTYDADDVAKAYNGGTPLKYADMDASLQALVTHAWDLDGATGTGESDLVGALDLTQAGTDATIDSAPGPYLPAYDATLTGFTSSPRSSGIPAQLAGVKSITFGTNKSVVTTSTTTLGKGARTLSFWLKTASTVATSLHVLNEASMAGAGTFFYQYGSTIYGRIYDLGSNILSGDLRLDGLNDDQWHHVVLAWDGTLGGSGLKVYIDGSSYAHGRTVTALQTQEASYPLQFNSYANTASQWVGSLCLVSTTAGRAWTAAEVAAHYADGTLPADVTASWDFNEQDTCQLTTEYSAVFDAIRYIDLGEPEDADLIPSNMTAFTYSMFVKLTNKGATDQYFFGGDNFKIRYDYSDDTWGVATTTDGGASFFIGDLTQTTELDRWYHVACVWDGTNLLLYVDGELKNTNPCDSHRFYATYQPRLGGSCTAIPGVKCYGKVALAEIHNVALTQAQVRELAQGLAIGVPVGKWEFEDTIALPYMAGAKAIDCNKEGYLQTAADTGESKRSVAFWMRASGTPTATQYIISECLAGATYTGFAAYFAGTGTDLYCRVYDGSTFCVNVDTIGQTVYDGQWHHVAFTWDGTTGTSGAKLYLDGVLIDQATATAATQGGPASAPLRIGARGTAATELFTGEVADIRLYSEALTQDQVRSLIAGTDYRTDLAAEWQFNDSPRSIASCADGYSIEFAGVDDQIVVLDPGESTTTLTASAWIKTDDLVDHRVILAHWRPTGNERGWWFYFGNTGQLRVRISSDGTAVSNLEYETAGSLVKIGEWCHVAFTFDNGDVVVYLNGVQVGSATASFTEIFDCNANVTIGALDIYPSYYFDGNIDDPRIYNAALSADDIATLAAGGEPTTLPAAHWTFNDAPQFGEVSDGDPVATLQSVDVNEWVFNQPTAANRMLYIEDGGNGRPCLRGNGTSTQMRHEGPILEGDSGVVIIVASVSAGAASQYFFSQSDEHGALNALAVGISSAEEPRLIVFPDGTAQAMVGEAISVDEVHVFEFSTDGTVTTLKVDGVTHSIIGTNNGNWFASYDHADNAVIGGLQNTAAASWADWDFYEMVAYDGPTDPKEIERVVRQLAAEYGVTLAQ